MSREAKLRQLKELYLELSTRYSFSLDELESLVKTPEIPLSIFDNNKLSTLEAVTKHLRESYGFRFSEIAALLHRNHGPIGITYRTSKKKMAESLRIDYKITLPVTIFSDKRFSPLENLVGYLKDNLGYSLSKIARLLHRDPRTIWTVYNRKRRKDAKE